MSAKVSADQLLAWFKEQGGTLHESLQTIKAQKSFLLSTTKAIKKGETLFQVPEHLVLSLDTSDFAEVEFTENHEEIFNKLTPHRAQALLSLFELLKPECAIKREAPTIARKKKKKKRQREAATTRSTEPVTGQQSIWGTFLQFVAAKEPLYTPAYWTEEERKMLKGTSLSERIEDMDTELQGELEQLIAPFFQEQSLKLQNEELLTCDLYKKFLSWALTYCWADENGEIFSVPLAELMSYTAHQEAANVLIKLEEDSIQIIAKSDLAPKETLLSFVGELGSAEFLWKWGMVDHRPTATCEKGCEADAIAIEPEVVFLNCIPESEVDDPLAEKKFDTLQELGLLMDLYEIGREGKIPGDLLLTAKVLCMDEEEFQLYANEMAQEGFLNAFDDDDDDDDESADAILPPAPEEDDEEEASTPAKAGSKKEPAVSTEGDDEEDENEEEDDDEDVGTELPEITNEASVYEALLKIAQNRLNDLPEASGDINWKKAGFIRKPSLACSYLVQVENEMWSSFIAECKERLANISSAPPTASKTSEKKRKLSGGEQPSAKKSKQ